MELIAPTGYMDRAEGGRSCPELFFLRFGDSFDWLKADSNGGAFNPFFSELQNGELSHAKTLSRKGCCALRLEPA